MDRYGYIRAFGKYGTELEYVINNTRYSFLSETGYSISNSGGKQYLSVSEDRDNMWLTDLGYKRILDNGLEEYIKDIIKNVCIPTISTLHVTEYKFPPQPYFDALITKINND